MLKLSLRPDKEAPLKVLCLGSHSDDIEIGCGGTLLRLTQEYPNLEFYWVIFSANEERTREAQNSAASILPEDTTRQLFIKNFRESYFPYIGAEIKDFFGELSRTLKPDLIFTHYHQDLHQDHRLISELTWNAYRNHLILEYEIPKWDGDLGRPNFYVNLNEELCQRKVKIILDSFKTQATKQWFSADTFMALMRLRGIESNSPGRYAEAFYSRKLVF